MAEIQQFDLARIAQNANVVNQGRQQNRLMELMAPLQIQEAQATAQDQGVKRAGAAARMALGVMGDLTDLTPEEKQTRFATARQLTADMGVDVSKIPEAFSDDVYRGIQTLAEQYSGIDPTKYQFGGDIVVQGPDGKSQVGTTRRDPRTGAIQFVSADVTGKLTDKSGLTPQEKAQLEAATAGNVEAQKLLARLGLTTKVAESEAEIEGAKAAAKADATMGVEFAQGIQKKAAGAQNVLESIALAEDLLDKATGSYAGAFLDQAGRLVGQSTGGAEAISALKIIENSLIMGMPRMEGPQSNADVQLYREAAASVGDATVPANTKRAALATIKQLNERYVARAGQPASAPRLPAAPRPAAPTQPTATLPPEIVRSLKPGVNSKLSDGTVWTLRNGQPVQVR